MDERTADKAADGGVSGAPDTWPLSASEAAAALGVSERTVRRAIARGVLPAAKRAGVYRIAPADLVRYQAGHRPPLLFAVRPQRDPPRLVPLPKGDRNVAPALPRPLTPLIGREREIAEACALLRGDAPLVTMIGPGGVGKTRLAVRVAAELAPDFADGVAFVGLAPVPVPALVLPTIAQALGVREAGDRSLVERLGALLGDRRLLLVLDNLEHLADASPQLADLLAACPGLTILATSRAVLHLSGEQVFPVPPLPLPDTTQLGSLDVLGRHGAVALFAQRARSADPGFCLTEENAAIVVEICRRLDGLPLAIELAAARVRSLPVPALLARLERLLPVLIGGPRDQPDRLQTMRSAIAWSDNLLEPGEQALVRRLAIFVGGFTFEGAEAVFGGDGDVFDLVAALVDSSLLRQETGSDGEPRYAMLETVREYALERLEASGEAEAARQAQAAFFLELAERADPHIWGGPGHRPWLDRLEAELDNLRAVLAWLEEVGDDAGLLRLTARLGGLWHYRSHRVEGRAWLKRALARDDGSEPAARAMAVHKLAMLERDLSGVSLPELVEEAVALRRALGHEHGVGHSLILLATLLDDRLDPDRVVRTVEEATAIFERLGDVDGLAKVRLHAGVVALERGDADRARSLVAESLALFRQDDFPFGIASALLALGLVEADRGQTSAAAVHYAESLRRSGEIGSQECLVDAVAGTGRLAASAGRPVVAARLLGAAAALRTALGYAAPPRERTRSERAASAACADLGEQEFAAAWAAGADLPLEAAVAEAETLLAALVQIPASADSATSAAPGGLTPRELDVVRLLAAGQSNRDIAAALFVSQSTAISHVRNILAKLGLGSRAAVATWAVRHGLA